MKRFVFSHQMKMQQSILEAQLTPFNILLRAVLSQLQQKDQYSIFAQPVNIKEVSNHLLYQSVQIACAAMKSNLFSKTSWSP